MPLKTFFNLTQEKQQKIINTCFKEFANNDYDSASLGKIIKEVGVAKGSFYRYFQDKNDVYNYLLKLSRSEILNAFKKSFSENESFFECWGSYLLAAFKLENIYPDLLRFRLKSSYENRKYKDNENRLSEKLNLVTKFLSEYQNKGEIRTDVPAETLAVIMLCSQVGIFNHLMMKNTQINDTNEHNYIKEIDNFLAVMKGGFKNS